MNKSKYKNVFIIYDNIKFKSKLEVNCYKILRENGFNPEYEPIKIKIFEGESLKINGYIPNKSTRDLERISNILPITYKIDFFFTKKVNNRTIYIFIEAKGRPNDVYPIKKKMFLSYLNSNYDTNPDDVYFFEVHNIKQIHQCIKIINSIV